MAAEVFSVREDSPELGLCPMARCSDRFELHPKGPSAQT